jgi:Family of unknown function (DUF5519)
MAHSPVLIDELANKLDSWPGVHIERRSDGAALVLFERFELGVLDREQGTAQLRFPYPEHDELVEHGDAAPAADETVSHDVRGPSDVTAALELFDRRYRELRGEDERYSTQDLP